MPFYFLPYLYFSFTKVTLELLELLVPLGYQEPQEQLDVDIRVPQEPQVRLETQVPLEGLVVLELLDHKVTVQTCSVKPLAP